MNNLSFANAPKLMIKCLAISEQINLRRNVHTLNELVVHGKFSTSWQLSQVALNVTKTKGYI